MKKTPEFDSVYSDCKDMVFRLCLGFCKNREEAEDLFQEIFLKVWKYLKTFRGDSKVSTWVYKVATNTALLYQSRSKNRSVLFEELHFGEYRLAQDSASEDERMNELLGRIRMLKKLDRIIISLILEDFSYKEIAEITGLKVNHIGVKVNRIKETLKKQVVKNG